MPYTGAERIIDFANEAVRLSVRRHQLVIRRDTGPEISTPLDEIATVILGTPRLSCTQAVLAGLMNAGASVLVCDDAMRPSGLMLPLDNHHNQTARMIAQARASLPRRKRIWQQIVRAKILAQGATLVQRTDDDAGLIGMAARVRSGDPDNLEAQAARRYWPRLFGDPSFRRRREAPDQNRLLNYGYAVLRAGIGRAVCAVGLHPSLGVHHRSRSNPFCLADDLMEPWRSLVDCEVAGIVAELGADATVDPPNKRRLIGLLQERLLHEGESRTVFDWMGRSASALAESLSGDRPVTAVRLFFPDGLIRP